MKPERTDDDDDRSDADLLAAVARHDVDAARARAAQGVFYARHVRYLYAVILRHKKNLLPLAGLSAEDLAQETFHRAFERAHTFERGDELDPDRQRMRARAWLGRIATNLLADHLSVRREISASPYLERVTCDAIDEEQPPSRSPRAMLVSEGLDQLSERERDVLRVSALHYRAGEEHQRLPNAVSAELASRWGTTNENIRAIRVRAMKKLKAFLVSQGAAVEEAT
jgi:RNA polymerase sigma factor (sigma-70 family)